MSFVFGLWCQGEGKQGRKPVLPVGVGWGALLWGEMGEKESGREKSGRLQGHRVPEFNLFINILQIIIYLAESQL